MYETHHMWVRDPADRRVPNFVGSLLPRKDKGDCEYYCATMLVLFKPWRTGYDLRRDHQVSWDDTFQLHAFSAFHERIMANFNLRYKCLDARDDYRAEMLQEVAKELPVWMSSDTYNELAAEGDQHMVLEDMADYGIDADLITNPARHGRRRKVRERQAAVIWDMMGPRGCNWSIAKPELADLRRVHSEVSITDKNPSE